jgi:hypothetical protein
MIKKLAVAITATATLAVPGVSMAADHGAPTPRAHAAAAGIEQILARQDCREKAFEDPAEFRFDYGRGKGAMQRCITRKIRKAHFECAKDARQDPFEYREDYGTGPAATQRCVRDELD